MHYLLVQPAFPVPIRSHNHKSFTPIGLLKIASWLRANGHTVELVVGSCNAVKVPDQVYITSLFTYWSSFVWDSVSFYRTLYSASKISVGGIYASLAPEHCRKSGCDDVFIGVHHEAESFPPAYDLLDCNFQIIHASRGCIRKCSFCGTHIIEPWSSYKKSIAAEIVKPHVVFYDNNFLSNPYIKSILQELISFRVKGRLVTSDCQSGFDGRLLTLELAKLLKAARFRYPRIAWDGSIDEANNVKHQIELLTKVGYSSKDISIFILFNYKIPPLEVFRKAEQCFKWGVQVADCRYRPFDLFEDNYRPWAKSQPETEYYVHEGWSDSDIRGFRRLIRQNNICLRYKIPRDEYKQKLEHLKPDLRFALMKKLGITDSVLTREDLSRLNSEWLRILEDNNNDVSMASVRIQSS